jgi:hypothetical protein
MGICMTWIIQHLPFIIILQLCLPMMHCSYGVFIEESMDQVRARRVQADHFCALVFCDIPCQAVGVKRMTTTNAKIV